MAVVILAQGRRCETCSRVYAAPGMEPTTDDWKRGAWVMSTEDAFGGKWTEAKLQVLRKYLHAYATIMDTQEFRFAYIDAFAGIGYWSEKRDDDAAQLAFPELTASDSSQYRNGSARIALETDPRFDRYLFVESSVRRAEQLATLRVDYPDKADHVQVITADANTYLLDLCTNRRWEKHRAVLFLDPYGMQVEWSTLEAIAQTKAIDMWYLFPLGVAVNRLLRKDASIESSIRARLDRLFGTDDWFDSFYELQERITLEGTERETVKTATFATIGDYINGRLKSVFPGVAADPLPLRNSKNVPIYLLCFAAANEKGAPTAVGIAQDVMLKEMAKT